jgi:hypothetical protein
MQLRHARRLRTRLQHLPQRPTRSPFTFASPTPSLISTRALSISCCCRQRLCLRRHARRRGRRQLQRPNGGALPARTTSAPRCIATSAPRCIATSAPRCIARPCSTARVMLHCRRPPLYSTACATGSTKKRQHPPSPPSTPLLNTAKSGLLLAWSAVVFAPAPSARSPWPSRRLPPNRRRKCQVISSAHRCRAVALRALGSGCSFVSPVV